MRIHLKSPRFSFILVAGGSSERFQPDGINQRFVSIYSNQIGSALEGKIPRYKEDQIMSADPDPFEQGQRAARENIPADGNPYQDGTQQHALWAAGHEEIAGEAEAQESEGT
jgi:hypothetical protein